ncbi:MAG: UDP-N-acetylglucosamine 2-epimerase (non-hydrolyzing) [Anaerolineaceae bacterium]|nr:UDP-N-acetylglucosamine 2-epimerase (non-hydrolyzing) [Anaerolineaceae bacterium]
MAKTRVMNIFGTRPEAIKLAPIIQLLEKDNRFESFMVVTAQHREMLDQVLSLFNLHPNEDLNLMTEDQSLAQLTTSIITHIDPLLEKYHPEWVIVQGDTTTAMTAALTAYYRHIKVAHIEAGLRTGDKWQPFPEEVNRRIIGTIADLHFAPTDAAWSNLVREGITKDNVKVTGNTIIDALNQVTRLPIPPEIEKLLKEKGILSGEKELVVITAHRRENFGEPICSICAALRQLAEKFQDRIELVYPVHLNPNIQKPVYELLTDIPNLTLLPPLEYLPLVHLLKHARLILTDSGGIQEEATGLGKPCLVLREVTERPEGVDAGVLKLVGTDTDKIVAEASRLLTDKESYDKIAHSANPYGDGKAAPRIVQILYEGF